MGRGRGPKRRFFSASSTSSAPPPPPVVGPPLQGYGLAPEPARSGGWAELAAANRLAPPSHWDNPQLPPDSSGAYGGYLDGDGWGVIYRDASGKARRAAFGISGGLADRAGLVQAVRRLTDRKVKVYYRPSKPGSLGVAVYHLETMFRLALVLRLRGEVRHPLRRLWADALLELLGLPPLPPAPAEPEDS